MQIKLAILAAGAAFAVSSAPAQAAACLAGTYNSVASTGTAQTTDVTPNASACVGYINGATIFNNSGDVDTVKAMLTALGFDWTGIDFGALYSDPGSKLSGLSGATSLSFGDAPMLFGDVVVGIHWGGQGGGRNAIYKIHLDTPTSSLTILGQNPGGSSDATLFGSTQLAVPEPESWTLLVGGFAAAGGFMRRRKARIARLSA